MGKKANPPVDYDSSKKGCMTEVVWAKHSSELSHTIIMNLPVNTTSKLQPCDQGVIRSMKSMYRNWLANFMLTADQTKDVTVQCIDDVTSCMGRGD